MDTQWCCDNQKLDLVFELITEYVYEETHLNYHILIYVLTKHVDFVWKLGGEGKAKGRVTSHFVENIFDGEGRRMLMMILFCWVL